MGAISCAKRSPRIPLVSSKRWRDPLSGKLTDAINFVYSGVGHLCAFCSVKNYRGRSHLRTLRRSAKLRGGPPPVQAAPSLPVGGVNAKIPVFAAYLLASIWACQTVCASTDTLWVATSGPGGWDSEGASPTVHSYELSLIRSFCRFSEPRGNFLVRTAIV